MRKLKSKKRKHSSLVKKKSFIGLTTGCKKGRKIEKNSKEFQYDDLQLVLKVPAKMSVWGCEKSKAWKFFAF
jgi:hypothetical protein